jgi:hypothetical protein
MLTNKKVITVFVLATVAFMISGSAASANAATTQQLPTCTDPTGQNLPCMMVISTLPPPANALQCQETSGQILPCSYTTQNLSNGNQIVAITVYAPANFIFSSPTVIKVVVHETTKTTVKIVRPSGPSPPEHTPEYNYGYAEGLVEGKYGVYDAAAACAGAKNLDHCIAGYHDAFLQVCIKSKFGCGDAIINYPPPIPQPICKPSPIPGVEVACPGLPVPSMTSSVGKGLGPICGAGNCTTGTTPPTVDCTKNPSDPSCPQQQRHTAAYLQALNSGSPNPYKPGTKDYEHYQAGLVARQQNSGAVAGIVTSGSTNSNNNNHPTTKKCPDGSTIPAKDKCPTSKQTIPSSPLTSLSTPSSPSSGSLSPPSGGSSSGGSSSGGGSGGSSNGGSGSGSGSGGGSGPSQPTTTS